MTRSPPVAVEPEPAHAVGRTPATPHSGVQVTGEGTGLLVLFQVAWIPTVVEVPGARVPL